MQRITTKAAADAFIDQQISELKAQIGDKKVLLALSGGVDSSVTCALLIKAVGKQLVCVHVNHGLLRKGEPEQVIEVFRNQMPVSYTHLTHLSWRTKANFTSVGRLMDWITNPLEIICNVLTGHEVVYPCHLRLVRVCYYLFAFAFDGI